MLSRFNCEWTLVEYVADRSSLNAIKLSASLYNNYVMMMVYIFIWVHDYYVTWNKHQNNSKVLVVSYR